jgi:peptidoglycan/LPS O-acetylase OafA/YrhL
VRGIESAWIRAEQLAEQTPPARNRYVDFLRAASILVVVIGHWLMAAPSLEGGRFSLGDMLRLAPWSQWLTWAFQVMPLFFIVGGYANAVSWEATQRRGERYGAWLAGRLRRLVAPVVPLLIAWSAMALASHPLGVPAAMVEIGSQVAFIPTWFLAVYVMVVVVAPGMHRLWRRFGMASFFGLAIGAMLIDAGAFAGDLGWLRWANYAFVWLGVHQLGFAWRDGKLAGPARSLSCAAAGLATLTVLVLAASYPVSMITVPGEDVSNSRPPTLALLALGMLHGGLVLTFEAPARRWLARLRPWTLTVLVNGSIMTLYLWHATVMVLAVGVLYWLGGFGLRAEPASGAWWATRPLWIVPLLIALSGFVAIFGRFEQLGRSDPSAARPAWVSVAGAMAVCGGIAALALGGIGATDGLGIRVWVLLLTLAGVFLATGRLPRLHAT